MFAILMTARKEKQDRHAGHLCSKHQIIQECGGTLEKLARQKKVTLVWVSGDTGVSENESADELTRSGSMGSCHGPKSFLETPTRYVNKALNSWVYKTLDSNWSRGCGCRQAHDLIAGPDKATTAWLLGRSRRTVNQLVEILAGHCQLNRHLSLMGIEQSPTCSKCEVEETKETSPFSGVLCSIWTLRHDVFGAPKERSWIVEVDRHLHFY
ncbi:hypothetical protein NQ317_000327 [Molorchus minor]|uniref:RNase H type-1 domain-containing protein n=1 Tax=Molorchus minor TaxID=1323400 RepID=A0ABQ9K1N0_9CUCU|nr:hypothetical protein NQ317_000327 [Molorchus minor]